VGRWGWVGGGGVVWGGVDVGWEVGGVVCGVVGQVFRGVVCGGVWGVGVVWVGGGGGGGVGGGGGGGGVTIFLCVGAVCTIFPQTMNSECSSRHKELNAHSDDYSPGFFNCAARSRWHTQQFILLWWRLLDNYKL